MKLAILLAVMCGVLGLVSGEEYKYVKEAMRKPGYTENYVEGEQSYRNKKLYKRPLSYESDKEDYESVKYKSPMKYEKPVYEKPAEYPKYTEYPKYAEYPKYGEYKEEKIVEYIPSSNPLTYGQLGERQSFVAENFTLNMNRVKAENPAATGGTIRRLTTQNMPGLQDMSSSLKYLKPCSINLPHYHPRGSELIHVLEAENLLVGFAEENGGRVLINNLGSSDTSFIPQGLVHFEMNMGCKPAFYLSTYNNVDPGLVTVSNRVFDFPLEVLEATYYLTEEQIKLIKRYLPNTPTAGVMNYGIDECIERCYKTEKYEANSYKSNKYQDSYKTESYEIKKARQYPDVEDAYEEESNEYETKQYKPKKYLESHETESYENKSYKPQTYATTTKHSPVYTTKAPYTTTMSYKSTVY